MGRGRLFRSHRHPLKHKIQVLPWQEGLGATVAEDVWKLAKGFKSPLILA